MGANYIGNIPCSKNPALEKSKSDRLNNKILFYSGIPKSLVKPDLTNLHLKNFQSQSLK